MKKLQRRFGMVPAVVAAAAVEVDEPEAFHFDTEGEDLLGPVGDDAAEVVVRLVHFFAERFDFGVCGIGQALHFRQQRAGIFVGKQFLIAHFFRTLSINESTFSFSFCASPPELVRTDSTPWSAFAFSLSTSGSTLWPYFATHLLRRSSFTWMTAPSSIGAPTAKAFITTSLRSSTVKSESETTVLRCSRSRRMVTASRSSSFEMFVTLPTTT